MAACATRESTCVLCLLQAVLGRVAPTVVLQAAMPDGLLSRMVHMQEKSDKKKQTGFSRMQECRDALSLLDDRGWKRSYHQRLFHDDFLKACTRIFWKLEAPGTFERQHCDILRRNNWEHLQQEILISTPRRFGKTISVSMFAAAMLFSAPNVEISIYSTCKRISQKLLNKVQQFFGVICQNDLKKSGFTVTRSNMEEIVLTGPEGPSDIRVVNSYPSKVVFPLLYEKSVLCKSLSYRARCREREHGHKPHVRAAEENFDDQTQEAVVPKSP